MRITWEIFERNIDARATLKDSDSIIWGGHWQFLKIPSAARAENNCRAQSPATLTPEKEMDSPCHPPAKILGQLCTLSQQIFRSCLYQLLWLLHAPLPFYKEMQEDPVVKWALDSWNQRATSPTPGHSQPSAPSHFLGCVVCAALRSFVKDLFSPGFTRKLQAGLVSTLLTLTQVPPITFLLTPTSRLFLFLYLLVYSVAVGFCSLCPKKHVFGMEMLLGKRAGGSWLQGPSPWRLVVLPVKCIHQEL